MKTFRFLTLAVIALLAGGFLQSCSDDDDGPGISSKDIIGLWELEHYTEWEKDDGEYIFQSDMDTPNEKRLEFLEDGTVIEYDYWRGSWRYYNDGTYSFKNGKLYIVFDEEGGRDDEPYNVSTPTSSTLILEIHDKFKEGSSTYEWYVQETYRKISDDE